MSEHKTNNMTCGFEAMTVTTIKDAIEHIENFTLLPRVNWKLFMNKTTVEHIFKDKKQCEKAATSCTYPHGIHVLNSEFMPDMKVAAMVDSDRMPYVFDLNDEESKKSFEEFMKIYS